MSNSRSDQSATLRDPQGPNVKKNDPKTLRQAQRPAEDRATDPLRPSDHVDGSGDGIESPRLGVVGWLRWGWRQLTSMRTALVLLLILAIAAIPGSIFPQRMADPNGVTQYKVDHPDLFPIMDSLQLFDVYLSAWFSAIYLLLFLSLVGCVIPRIKHHFKALRSRPPRRRSARRRGRGGTAGCRSPGRIRARPTPRSRACRRSAPRPAAVHRRVVQQRVHEARALHDHPLPGVREAAAHPAPPCTCPGSTITAGSCGRSPDPMRRRPPPRRSRSRRSSCARCATAWSATTTSAASRCRPSADTPGRPATCCSTSPSSAC
ncbi:hypothetical protein MICRO8M_110169 [Microbacterium sp. 8M]|nr:hypothetical protein MICRO8M_110169 [Microbacterium sp. 8M]